MPSPPFFNAYDESDNRRSARVQQPQHPQQSLRRRGAPVPAPSPLLSTRSSVAKSLHSTPVENLYESSPTVKANTEALVPSSSSSSSSTAAPSLHSPPHRGSSARHHPRVTPYSSSVAATDPTAAFTSKPSSSSAHTGHSRHGSSRVVSSTPSVTGASTPLNATTSPSALAGAVPGSEHRPRNKLSCTPAAASPSSIRSFPGSDAHRHSGGTRSRDDQRNRNSGALDCGSQSHSTPIQSPASLPDMRQETDVPGISPALTSARSNSKLSSAKVVTAAPTIMSNAERMKAERAARKELRDATYRGDIKVSGYVAQTAYAQKNPFRCQDFAEFTANPTYEPPSGFDIYSQAMATRVYGLEVSRASQGEFMMQRLVEAAHPATATERAEMEALLSSVLEKLQVGDWFYKWTRINHVHQRYVWLNLQRGTLMWSMSPKQSVVLNAEIKLSTVTSITPDCLQLEVPMRVFYRMTINTPDRCISLATEIRKKFDVWYRVLLQLTAPNLVYGVPAVWGRPSNSVNTTGRGAASRWASRFSPLDAVVNDTTGHMGQDEIYTRGLLSSSD
ncbi:hypothetical protein ABL78_3698 [Leptomonas seymouri]|uniref:Pleckstrin homology domain-containing protein n=1 Tax=Leptomonas seymouri TaxID=5684 RepID=A0A0N1IL66_LEPSE|nr:hypothetical protein ABL78_3698 [Leptomonas seymouri]|eukprot:KPI87228.1 hypothetical protein ABL78_3698 [Leptomonas seymouri]